MKDWRVRKSSQVNLGRQWVVDRRGGWMVRYFHTHAEAIRYAQERAVCYRILDDIESGTYENP